jgi:hypothetical protein
VAVAVLIGCGSVQCKGTDIYFGDANRAPADMLTVDGVFISSSVIYTSNPTTVQGIGLGSATVGPSDSIDWTWHYDEGSTSPTRLREGLSISVAGDLESITLSPHMSITGYTQCMDFPFYCRLAWFYEDRPFYEQYQLLDPTNPDMTQITLSPFPFPDSQAYRVDLDISSFGQNDTVISSVRDMCGPADASFDLGFTIVSLSYEPIPEPGAASITLAALLSAFYFKRRIK